MGAENTLTPMTPEELMRGDVVTWGTRTVNNVVDGVDIEERGVLFKDGITVPFSLLKGLCRVGPVRQKTTRLKPKVASSGGSSSYYQLPDGASELNDLIEDKEMSFARGNMFKALYRLGAKEGIDVEYDLNKIELFLGRLRKMNKEGTAL